MTKSRNESILTEKEPSILLRLNIRNVYFFLSPSFYPNGCDNETDVFIPFFYIKESFPILHYKVVSKVMDIKKKLIVVYVPL